MLARRAMKIAAEVCVFTNDRLTIESRLKADAEAARLARMCCLTAEPSPPGPPRCFRAARRSAPGRFADCTPLAPVKVDASRVIRTVAGLRPYRRSGFVVRAEPLGEKRLVHNYGHGGGGITLSWGSRSSRSSSACRGTAARSR